ncbi:MAG: acylphosphatase [Ignavibacteria bacterium]
MKIKAEIIVKGFVQGVGYRYYCYRKAIEFGLTGYVKNLINGNVELVAEGEKSMVKDFVRELKIGPSHAKVNTISVEEFPFTNEFEKFEILK